MSVRADGVSVRYGTFLAVREVSFAASPGEILGVVGPNGSGKSTLVRAIAGHLPHSGRISLGQLSRAGVRIGYMPQDNGSRAALTVLEVVLLGRLGALGLRVGKADLAAVREVLSELGIAQLAATYMPDLSGGQRQLVFLAQALASAPSVLLLDEPISALDIRHQLTVLSIVRRLTTERGLTTLMVLHDLNAAVRFCDRVAVLHQGRLATIGSPVEVFTCAVIAEVFGVEAAVFEGVSGILTISPVRPL